MHLTGFAAGAQHTPAGGLIQERADQCGLADPGRPLDQYQPRRTRAGLLEDLAELRQERSAAHKQPSWALPGRPDGRSAGMLLLRWLPKGQRRNQGCRLSGLCDVEEYHSNVPQGHKSLRTLKAPTYSGSLRCRGPKAQSNSWPPTLTPEELAWRVLDGR